jgi:hypothetical protein
MFSPSNPWPPGVLIAFIIALLGWEVYLFYFAEPNIINFTISLVVLLVGWWAWRDNYT